LVRPLSIAVDRKIRAPAHGVIKLEPPEPKPAAVHFDFPVPPISERIILLPGKTSGEKIAKKHCVPLTKCPYELNSILSPMLPNQRNLAQSVLIGHIGMFKKPGGAS